MSSSRSRPRRSSILVAACLLGGFLSGCTVVGPATVLNGRLAYNEAILKTDNQQMLLLAVQNRYGERSNLLAVASVTANVRVATSAGIEVGVGNKDNYSGSLVPFSAGVAYEENPTISYTPVGGEQYARQLLSPLSVALLAQLSKIWLTRPLSITRSSQASTASTTWIFCLAGPRQMHDFPAS